MTIGSPVASAVSGPGTAETNAMRLPSGDQAMRLAGGRQRAVRPFERRQELRARAVRMRHHQAGFVAQFSGVGDPLAVRRPLSAARRIFVFRKRDGMPVRQRHDRKLRVRPAGAVVAVDGVGEARAIGREGHAASGAKFVEVAARESARLRKYRNRSRAAKNQKTRDGHTLSFPETGESTSCLPFGATGNEKNRETISTKPSCAVNCPPMHSILLRTVLLIVPVALSAATARPEPDLAKIFNRREVEIPMRDGVKLYTDIYIPKKSHEKLPFLITRTPYGSVDDKGRNGLLANSYKDFVTDGYIFVFQDIRGRYKSEGQFVMMRPPRDKSDPKAIDESTDTYDTIEWLLKHVPNNNGRAGVLGISYPRLADRDGDDRSAPGAEGRLRAGVAGRHVPGRRLPSQRRLPPELRLRIRGHDGNRQEEFPFPVRQARHLRMVPAPGPALRQRQQALLATASCPPGTISWSIPTTTSSGRSRRSRRTWKQPRCRT